MEAAKRTQQIKDLDAQLEAETQKIKDKYDTTNLALETVKLTPGVCGILWLPCEG